MVDRPSGDSRGRSGHPVVRLSIRVLGRTLQPFSSAAGAAMNIGVDLAPSAAARVLDNPRIELLVSTTLSSERIHTAFVRLLESDAATQLVDEFFDSGLFDRFITRLVESEALWELIDTIADSPAVTAAITQQSLGFA